MKSKFTIGLVQIGLNNSPEKNLEKSLLWVRNAAKQGAEVICLPELYSSFYFCQKEDTKYFAFAEELYSTSFKAFSALAKELKVVIIVPFFEKRAMGLYHNTAYIIDANGSEAGLYRKCIYRTTPCSMKNTILRQVISDLKPFRPSSAKSVP